MEAGDAGGSTKPIRRVYEFHRPQQRRPQGYVPLYAHARTVDQRMWIMNRQGRGPFAISCQGHEAAQVGSAFALTAGRDWICPYYRDAGAAIALGTSILDIMLAFCAKAEDPFGGGRQLPNHYSSRRLRILSGSSSVGSQIPHATGIGLAAKLRGEESVVLTYFGEGAISTGDFHAGINFASIHKLPVIFFAENNGWAISVPTAKQMNLDSLADRALGYGVPGVVVDGTDILAVYQVTSAAIDRCLAGEGPTLIAPRSIGLCPIPAMMTIRCICRPD